MGKEKGTLLMNKSQRLLKLLEEQINEYIRKKGSKWCVFSHKTDRNMGCYSKKSGAKKRLGQIHYFKNK